MQSIDSLCAREMADNRTTKPHVLPIYQTSSFAFDNIDQGFDIFAGKEKGHVYTRYGNPTFEATAAKIAAMETHALGFEASALMFSSGMSALYSLIITLLKSGDKILTQGNLYGGSTELLKEVCSRAGIETIFSDLTYYDRIEEIVKADSRIKLLYFETPANPTLQCVDIEILCGIAQKHKLQTAIDNTFPTPYLQQPFSMGADYILHSTTKYLNGHGNAIAGIIVGRDEDFIQKKLWKTRKLTGTQPGVMECWLTYQGIKTLALRMDRHCSNAMTVARYLESHSKVDRVNYVGLTSHEDHAVAKKQMRDFGGMLSFEVKGGLESGVKFMRKLKHFALAPTLGDVDTLVLHPASMSHLNIDKDIREANGITDGLIRVSIGIENPNDIIAEIDQALL